MIRLATLLLVLLLAAPAGAADGWYAERITRGDVPLRVEHLWANGARFRGEIVILGRPILTLVNGDLYYVIDQISNTGISIRRSPKAIAADAGTLRPFGDEAERIAAEGGEKVRQERVRGRLCDVYRLTDGMGRREVWVTADKLALPIRIDAFERATSRTVRMDYVDWTRQIPIPNAFFEPDPRVQLQHFEYDDYMGRAAKEPVGPAPVLYGPLLHGR